MSEAGAVLLVGATGVVGTLVMQRAAAMPDLRLAALARRQLETPDGVELHVSDPAAWREAAERVMPDAVICALGTTWRDAGQDEAAFRAVDHDLVLKVAEGACKGGARRFVLVSSVGASPSAGTFYLKVKGEVEAAVSALGFERLDILRPGLLRAKRGGTRRFGERLAILASPVTDAALHGSLRRYRSIDAREVAAAALQLTRELEPGRFVHEHDAIRRAADRLERGT
jgi:uncharacterized protein YbjT (DUF2867 family)